MTFFKFEADFVEALRCIPMQVRLKLDTCGIKLKLQDWNHFTQAERQTLVELPCLTSPEILQYREQLNQVLIKHTGKSGTDLAIDQNPPWMDAATIPESVTAKAQELGLTVTDAQWSGLQPLQRFALIKLSRSSHENKNFLPAVREFHLVA
ncbi:MULTISPECIES: nitrate reductase associated protein [unclassified Microcoleus]|uniref:nitrate reductase associated protein n=1 Tax=unclassified Microcoleus TaxID=2642155 RepID=UPI001D8CF31E|nr:MULTISPECIES: nitrate reductase associated protein [unclassified Microcoleus]MCC3421114.1 nitrate reductase associated protein [Microcoleus sp. PH2017_07_MST_O_A]MCC3511317.1 nitrate reductase associated protein [Microcoleus sp. PH2017_17_BER_D_A]TAE68583.1 MAG: nitrate reductase associated protein [Oscillatoriales cyanobacterium]MCC3415319.1 nitrate reductase associated protein [Microcoleus sp. PH2017_02_FOX_O_A]MCC3574869.1 nitrate reductase associated protein [Microcoleus sp. PH2017_34_R